MPRRRNKINEGPGPEVFRGRVPVPGWTKEHQDALRAGTYESPVTGPPPHAQPCGCGSCAQWRLATRRGITVRELHRLAASQDGGTACLTGTGRTRPAVAPAAAVLAPR